MRTVGGSAPQPGWLLTFTVAGRRAYRPRGAQFDATPGVLALLGQRAWVAGRPQRLADPWEAWYVRFQPWPRWSPPSSFERLADGVYRAHVSLASTRQRIEDAFGRLAADLRTRLATRAVDSIEGPVAGGGEQAPLRLELLLMTLREIFVLVEEEPRVRMSLEPRVREALEVMGSNLTAPHSVDSLAGSCGLSPSRFAHLFRAELGISPVRALRRMRLREAALQLRYGDGSIEAIAEGTGFTSPSHLSREFRRHFGVSPLSYRNGVGDEPRDRSSANGGRARRRPLGTRTR